MKKKKKTFPSLLVGNKEGMYERKMERRNVREKNGKKRQNLLQCCFYLIKLSPTSLQKKESVGCSYKDLGLKERETAVQKSQTFTFSPFKA